MKCEVGIETRNLVSYLHEIAKPCIPGLSCSKMVELQRSHLLLMPVFSDITSILKNLVAMHFDFAFE